MPKLSLFACYLILAVFLWFHITATHRSESKTPIVTTWDAFGYYLYLPSMLIYKDYKQLHWVEKVDSQYHLTGGVFYQAGKVENTGKYVFKYLGGVAIAQLPLFLTAHALAGSLGYPQDGFSAPYQFAIAYGALLYFFLALLLLRKILLRYFENKIVTWTLLAMALASNLIQYIAVDGAMSHAFIFPLYVLILYFTIRWHDQPSLKWAVLIGLIIGWATICRPTELIMLFIPLLWNTHSPETASNKWAMVKANKTHIFGAIAGGFIGILPQLIYWKSATGSWIHDVGSKWYFLNPFFRVLFGFENGWFVYTPIAIFFVAGLFFLTNFPFKKSILTFCLLNIYIIISWADWHYGATYSCRAMTQSYPIFALAFAAFIQYIDQSKWRLLFGVLCCYLIGVNLFQIKQYDNNILHYRDMNRRYYGAIYLNPHPTTFQMSLLDNEDFLSNESGYSSTTIFRSETAIQIAALPNTYTTLAELPIQEKVVSRRTYWLKVSGKLFSDNTPVGYLCTELTDGELKKYNKTRLHHALALPNQENEYGFYVEVPATFQKASLRLFLHSTSSMNLTLKSFKIEVLKQ